MAQSKGIVRCAVPLFFADNVGGPGQNMAKGVDGLLALALIGFVLALLVFSQNRMYLRGTIDGLDANMLLRLSLLDGFVRLRLDIVLIYEKDAGHNLRLVLNGRPLTWQRPNGHGRENRFAKRFFLQLRRRLRLDAATLDVFLGDAGDAARTAMGCGAAMAAVNTLAALCLARYPGAEVSMAVSPVFGQNRFYFKGLCMMHIRTGQSIFAAILAALGMIKGGWNTWRTRLNRSWAPRWKT